VSESKVKVAAVQAAPVFLDLEASLQKALGLIEKAAGEGARLVVFPEAFLPAWPAWVDEVLPGEDAAWHVRLLEQSMVVPGPVTERLGAAAHQAGVHLVMGVDERMATR
jgi:nitrilase